MAASQPKCQRLFTVPNPDIAESHTPDTEVTDSNHNYNTDHSLKKKWKCRRQDGQQKQIGSNTDFLRVCGKRCISCLCDKCDMFHACVMWHISRLCDKWHISCLCGKWHFDIFNIWSLPGMVPWRHQTQPGALRWLWLQGGRGKLLIKSSSACPLAIFLFNVFL